MNTSKDLGFCPDGWKFIGNSRCQAQKTNLGTCTKESQFPGWYNMRNWANYCNTTWTNAKQLLKGQIAPNNADNKLGNCPDGWKYIGNDTCEPQMSNLGKCSHVNATFNRSKSDGMSVTDYKRQWANGCETQWRNCKELKHNEIAPMGFTNDCGYLDSTKELTNCGSGINQIFNNNGTIKPGLCYSEEQKNQYSVYCMPQYDKCANEGKYGNYQVDGGRYWFREGGQQKEKRQNYLGHELPQNIGFCALIVNKEKQTDGSIKITFRNNSTTTNTITFNKNDGYIYENASALCFSAIETKGQAHRKYDCVVTANSHNYGFNLSIRDTNFNQLSTFDIPANTSGFSENIKHIYIQPSPIQYRAQFKVQEIKKEEIPPKYQQARSTNAITVDGGIVSGTKAPSTYKCPEGKCPNGCSVPEDGNLCDGEFVKKDGKCYKTCRYTCSDMDTCKSNSCCKNCGTKLVEVKCYENLYSKHPNQTGLKDQGTTMQVKSLGKFPRGINDCLEKCHGLGADCQGVTYFKENPNSNSQHSNVFQCFGLSSSTGSLIADTNTDTYRLKQADNDYYNNK